MSRQNTMVCVQTGHHGLCPKRTHGLCPDKTPWSVSKKDTWPVSRQNTMICVQTGHHGLCPNRTPWSPCPNKTWSVSCPSKTTKRGLFDATTTTAKDYTLLFAPEQTLWYHGPSQNKTIRHLGPFRVKTRHDDTMVHFAPR